MNFVQIQVLQASGHMREKLRSGTGASSSSQSYYVIRAQRKQYAVAISDERGRLRNIRCDSLSTRL